MLRWCIAIAAQMTPTYHTAGLRPHFSLPPATSFIQMSSCPRFFLVAILTAVPLVPMPELEADQGSPLLLSWNELHQLPTDQDSFHILPDFTCNNGSLSYPPPPYIAVYVSRMLTFPSNHSTAPNESYPSCRQDSHCETMTV